MEHMVHSEAEKYKSALINGLKKRFEGKLDDADVQSIAASFDIYIREMIKLMREGKSAHEKFFSDIILHSVDAIIGINPDGKIFLWNNGAETIFGYKREEATDRDISIIITDASYEKGQRRQTEKIFNEKGFITNLELRAKDNKGEWKDISMSQHLIFDDKGEKLGSVAIMRDLTNEKMLEKELREKENLALIGQIVSSIAHNLSNPLNIISGNADYLLLDKKVTDEGYEELNIIVDEATRITKSIRQILNFARPLSPMRELTEFNEIVKNAASGFKYLSDSDNVKLFVNYDKTNTKIKIDRELFKDVILNLLTNAIQAIPSERKGVIEVSINNVKKNLVLEISDNGYGIAEKDLPYIFKPFYSTKGYGKGTGLGLAFTERVIKEHGGKIKIVSSFGKGTKFVISLPIEDN